jgi:hypothetical protein
MMLPANQLRLPGEHWEEAADPPPPDPELERDADDVFKPRRPKPIEWRPIPGYSHRYDASPCGLIRDNRTGRVLDQTPSGKNTARTWHVSVSLVDAQGRRTNQWVHRLILMTFVGPPADGWHAAHLSDDPADNRVANLRWATPAQNARDTAANGGRDRTRHEQIERTRLRSLERLRARIAAVNADLEQARAA